MPSILFMVFGGLGALYCLYVFFSAGAASTQEAVSQILRDPNLPRDVRDAVARWLVPGMRIYSVMGMLAGGLLIFSGVQMRNLKGYGLAIAACVVGMLPCTSCVCCLTLPVAVWTLTILTRPEIKSSFT